MSIEFYTDIKLLHINKIKEAEINSNELTEKEYEKLKQNILQNGFSDPIKVRKNGSGYIVVDGHHRLKALIELGETKIPCILLDTNPTKSTIDSIQFNTLRGEQNQKKLAELIKSLQNSGYSLEQIEHELVYDLPELEDKLALLDLPENLDDILKEQRDKELDELPIIYSFIVPQKYKEPIDKVFETGKGHKGQILGEICQKVIQKKL